MRHHDVEFRNKTTLFEDVELIHYALTSTNLDEIDLSVNLFGKRSGAIDDHRHDRRNSGGGRVQSSGRGACGKLGIGFGWLRAAILPQPELTSTFQVRDGAPDVLLFGNIGIAHCETATRE